MEFKLKYPNSAITFLLKGSDFHKKKIYIDEFMIYKANTLNYKIVSATNNTSGELVKNNQHIKTDNKSSIN